MNCGQLRFTVKLVDFHAIPFLRHRSFHCLTVAFSLSAGLSASSWTLGQSVCHEAAVGAGFTSGRLALIPNADVWADIKAAGLSGILGAVCHEEVCDTASLANYQWMLDVYTRMAGWG